MSDGPFRYQKVEDYIRSMAQRGTLTVGQRLPSLRQLSGSLRLSIATVNTAYQELERKGLVEARQRSGFFWCGERCPLPQPQGEGQVDDQPRGVSRPELTRDVLDTVGCTDLLPFSVICPDVSLLPGKALSRLLQQQMREQGDLMLGYSEISGDRWLRQKISRYAADMGIQVDADEIIVTCGAMEALYLALRTLTRPGDSVVIASPTYHCFLQLIENCGLRAIELPSDPQRGISPQLLEKVLQRQPVSACILCGNFNNPDGSQLSDADKQQIVELLARHDVPLVEDDVAGDLYFGEQRPSTFKSYDRNNRVLHCNSFSKTLAPGFRVGWLLPARYYDRALEMKYTTNVSCATPTQRTVAAYLDAGYHTRHLRRLRHSLATSMHAMLQALGRTFPDGTRVTRPAGGSVLWLELPQRLDGVDFFLRAKQQGIAVAPGAIFTTQDCYGHFIRLSYSGVWNDCFERGVEHLGRLAGEMMDEQ
ncbi:PLP-dependent aminotransferase family protein [uncultured Desulfuromonas sp.]|uniref:aminotransferase-like domain-containing protein n=1 Tax=uncultured Desulfuromonas sp. TaxID=181013 RepID=UPI002AAB8345|nr:PLP-dependent aminotransferase family protein [uncultured Desulfuromonas sp.]